MRKKSPEKTTDDEFHNAIRDAVKETNAKKVTIASAEKRGDSSTLFPVAALVGTVSALLFSASPATKQAKHRSKQSNYTVLNTSHYGNTLHTRMPSQLQ